MASHGGQVGIAETPKNTKVGVIGCLVVEQSIWDGIANGGSRAPVQQVHHCGKRLCPIRCRHVCMNKHGATDIVQCAKNAFGLAILWRSVGTREA